MRPRTVMPLLAGLALTALVATGAVLGLRAALRGPTAADRIMAAVVVRLERLGSMRSLVVLGRREVAAVVCTTARLDDRIVIDHRVHLRIAGERAHWVAGPRPARRLLAAQAALAGCPRDLASELVDRLRSGKPALVRKRRVLGRPSYVLVLSHGRPVVRLIVTRRRLVPIALRFDGDGLVGFSALGTDRRSLVALARKLGLVPGRRPGNADERT